MTLQQNRVRPITLLSEVGFRNYVIEMITILRRRVTRNIRVATLKVKVTAWPCSKIVSTHIFVIWSRISKLFHRNDQHIETTCHTQHLGRYLAGQGHSMTLQQKRVWPKTLLFEVWFYNYFWQTTSLCPIPIWGELPGSDRLLFTHRLNVVESCEWYSKSISVYIYQLVPDPYHLWSAFFMGHVSCHGSVQNNRIPNLI